MPGHRKRRQFKQTDAFTRGMAIGLKRAGWSIRQIAADTHLGASTVHRLWRRWLEQGNVAIYRNAGATRVTSARVDRRILRQAVAAPQATCTAILQHVQDTLDHYISTRTISRRFVANGLHSCRPLRRLPLTPPNGRQRLEWCRARSTWMTEWHRFVFSDESRFCLSSDSRRVRVWRRREERSNPAAIVERPTVRQRGIMVWGAIAYDSRSPLLRIQGTMTAQRYVDDVLRPVTLPYLQGVPNALYQQDNARPHTARISQQALQDHVWDIIGRRLHALPQPRSEDELWQMVEREWRAIPQDAILTLIDSLPRRVAACIAVRGELASGDVDAAQEYPANFAEIINDNSYTPDQVFIADESGLFWEKMPERTYVSKFYKSASGHKAAKDRITILFCNNASGDYIMKPLVVNKSKMPRAFKGVNINNLPVYWRANKKAWITAAMFTEWFHECFIPDAKKYLSSKGLPFKVLLLIDNAPGHPQDLEYENVKIVQMAHSLGGEGFDDFTDGDIAELMADKELSEDDLVNLVCESESDKSDEEELVPVTFTAKVIREGLALGRKLGNHFMQNDTNVERALRFQRDINRCSAQHEEVYIDLTKNSKQLLITDFITISHNVNISASNIESAQMTSSDESEFEPSILKKRMRVISDSDEGL
ncbi:TIGD1 [Cordylochernes scorpioides]|uniref:TIGD1 n=1 Tax=Cordylochernes scorpioides TaxID=51811 RepID=A0ABY6K1F6_9ARAC|nr:TIGD1 [Cordylochernes scorpioides]